MFLGSLKIKPASNYAADLLIGKAPSAILFLGHIECNEMNFYIARQAFCTTPCPLVAVSSYWNHGISYFYLQMHFGQARA